MAILTDKNYAELKKYPAEDALEIAAKLGYDLAKEQAAKVTEKARISKVDYGYMYAYDTVEKMLANAGNEIRTMMPME